MEVRNVSRLAFYLFDSELGIRNFSRLNFPKERARLGLETVCVTTDDVVPVTYSNSVFDHIVILPAHHRPDDPCCLSAEQVSFRARRLAEERFAPHRIAVISCGEYTGLVAAIVRETLGVEGPRLQQAEGFRDKLLMKQVASTFVAVPQAIPFERERFAREGGNYLDAISASLGSPFIMKPTNMSSSHGVRIVQNGSDAADVAVLLDAHLGDFEAEEYIDGTQYHCESLYHEGRLLVSLVSRFNASLLELMKGRTVGTMPVPMWDRTGKKVSECAHRASLALGARDGVTHTEVIVKRDGTVLLIEIASRGPGGDVVGRYKEAFGVDILEVDQRIKSGIPFNLSVTDFRRYSFWAFVPKPDGVISELSTPRVSGLIEIDWFVSCGDRTTHTMSFEDPAALVIVRGGTYEDVSADFEAVLDFPFIHVTGGD